MSKIVTPTNKDIQSFGTKRKDHKVCGSCRHFNHKEGQKSLYQDKQLAVIVNDYGWKEQHLMADPTTMALCGLSDRRDGLLVGPHSLGCEQWRAK